MLLFENLFTSPPVAERPAPSSAVATAKPGADLRQPPAPRQNPWIRLGKAISPTGDPAEALKASGLDWSVSKVGLRTEDLAPVPGHYAIRRDDNGGILGIVGGDYQILQNREAFGFFKDLAGEAKLSFETAGCFRGGKVAWVMAHIPDLGIRIGDDESKTYLFISTGHGGNKPLMVAPTTLRIICKNTLRLAEAGARHRINSVGAGTEAGYIVRHTTGMAANIEDIREAYQRTIAAHRSTTAFYQALAGKPMTEAMKKAFFKQVFDGPTGPDETGRAKSLRENRNQRLEQILVSPTSLVRGTKDTAFSLFQAAVEYIDHDRPTRTDEGTGEDEQRLASAMFGSGAVLKARARDAAIALI